LRLSHIGKNDLDLGGQGRKAALFNNSSMIAKFEPTNLDKTLKFYWKEIEIETLL